MNKPRIYIAQFGSGTNINLLPLAAGQLYSRLKQDHELSAHYQLAEIIFRRPQDVNAFASQLDNVAVIGFSCFLWNTSISLRAAQAVKERFPQALIVLGGPSISNVLKDAVVFLDAHRFVDVICINEGEDVLPALCWHHLKQKDYSDIPGVIFRDAAGRVRRNDPAEPCLARLPSPYLDGTFDELYAKYNKEFSGIIWETNRGCPYECAYCTWGNLPSRKIREKPMEQVRQEIEWIGRHHVKYIAMSDANFGIRKRDVEVTELLADCKKKYGVPDFISVSWVKNSSDKVLRIADILQRCGIGFRVTLSLQSLNPAALKAAKRLNISRRTFDEIKKAYRSEKLYSYTELILGLPGETLASYLHGIDECLSDSVFEQLYIYPCLLFPNTYFASAACRRQYDLESKIVPNRYTKSREFKANEEQVEIVIGTATMPRDKWREAFVLGYYTLALNDDRLAFFILQFLKRMHGIRITELVAYTCATALREKLPLLTRSFARLEVIARQVQEDGHSHLIEPRSFGGIPYDPPEGIFLELLLEKDKFYREFRKVLDLYLRDKAVSVDPTLLDNLFVFQNAVMAHPDGTRGGQRIQFSYNWIDFFAFAFNLEGVALHASQCSYLTVDSRPSGGDPQKFLKNHFDIRGIPSFNELYDLQQKKVFPPVNLSPEIGNNS